MLLGPNSTPKVLLLLRVRVRVLPFGTYLDALFAMLEARLTFVGDGPKLRDAHVDLALLMVVLLFRPLRHLLKKLLFCVLRA